MMLANTYSEDKIKYPVYISEKLDGVPCGITFEFVDTVNGRILKTKEFTRQGKSIGYSVAHIVDELALQWEEFCDVCKLPSDKKITLWGELYVRGWYFKEISGAVRKQAPCPDLQWYLFDIEVEGVNTFEDKYENHLVYVKNTNMVNTHVIPHTLVFSKDDAEDVMGTYPSNIEGFVYRNPNGVYKHTRSWDMIKRVFETATDLRIVDMLPAINKNGEQKPMIGMFVMEDAGGKRYNIGPGKSTHAERKAWFKNFDSISNLIAKVKHKVDNTYKGLRQPTFQCLHLDKTEPDLV